MTTGCSIFHWLNLHVSAITGLRLGLFYFQISWQGLTDSATGDLMSEGFDEALDVVPLAFRGLPPVFARFVRCFSSLHLLSRDFNAVLVSFTVALLITLLGLSLGLAVCFKPTFSV